MIDEIKVNEYRSRLQALGLSVEQADAFFAGIMLTASATTYPTELLVKAAINRLIADDDEKDGASHLTRLVECRKQLHRTRVEKKLDDLKVAVDKLVAVMNEDDAVERMVEQRVADRVAIAVSTARDGTLYRSDPRWIVDQMVAALLPLDYEKFRREFKRDAGREWPIGESP